MRFISLAGIAAAAVLALPAPSLRAEEDLNPAAMAKALQQTSLPLEKATKLSDREGKPISAKYEIEHGGLRLSVYTKKGDRFSEVIVDHETGAVARDEWITDADDMRAAQDQAEAMSKAKTSLDIATENAVMAHPGYRAVSVMPELEGGRPVAIITLMKGEEVKRVSEMLD